MRTKLTGIVAVAVLGMLPLVTGCGDATSTVAETDAHAEHHDHEGHDDGLGTGQHDGWWCVEHGVPEGECTRCDDSLIAGFKEKGDWCEEHDLPASQCFKCNPEFAENFIARYEAKYGKKPPAPTE